MDFTLESLIAFGRAPMFFTSYLDNSLDFFLSSCEPSKKSNQKFKVSGFLYTALFQYL